MKIAAVEVIPLAARLSRPFHWSSGTALQRSAVLIRITTDCGLVGWGEALQPQAGQIVRDVLAPLLIGQDPLARLPLRLRMAAGFRSRRDVWDFRFEALGAVDIALWDLAGKALGQPLHRLLGGAIRNRIRTYASGLYYGVDEAGLAAEAAQYAGGGFVGVKMKIGRRSVAEDLVRVGIVRRVLGESVSLMVDANQAYDRATAIEMGLELEEMGVFWLEEPLPARDVGGYAHLATCLTLRIAAGESLHGWQDFYPFLSGRLISVAQPNVGTVGGVTESLIVVTLAETFGISLAFHGWGTPILMSATLNLLACSPLSLDRAGLDPSIEGPIVELDCTPNPLRDVLPWEVFALRDGTLCIPDGPGLGIELDERLLAPYRVGLGYAPGGASLAP